MDKVKCSMVGTLEFMAPEVMKCTFASPASDMWSLGVVLMMLVSGGISPFWAGTDIATQRRVARGQYSLDDSAFDVVSNSSKELIKKLLVLIPSKRLTAKAVLAHPWLAFDHKTAELGRVTRLETSRMRSHLARWRWMVIRRSIQAMRVFINVSHESEISKMFLDSDNPLLFQLKKNKLKKCFRRNSKVHKKK